MGNPFRRKISWILAVGLVLVHVSPAAAELLVCIAEEADPGCCDEPVSASRRVVEPQALDSSDCDCCVTVGGVAAKADATPRQISADAWSGASFVRCAVRPSVACLARAAEDDPGNPRLSSLRTVVLLI